MKIQPLTFLNAPHQKFDLEHVIIKEWMVEIYASNKSIKVKSVFPRGVIYMQTTDESYKIKTIFDLSNDEYDLLNGTFFQFHGDRYLNYLREENLDCFDVSKFYSYVFFFSDSVIEIVSPDEPIFTEWGDDMTSRS